MTIAPSLISRLKDPSLAVEVGYVGGVWTSASSRIAVANPSTGEVVALVSDLGIAETRIAIDAAHLAQSKWASKTGKERAALIRRWHDLIISNVDDLATILTTEMGKPISEARSEVLYGAAYVEWFGEEAKRIYGDTIPGHQADKRIVIFKQPIGVVGAITPWNFPCAMVLRKVAPALAAGCAIICKPAAETPLSAIALAVLSERAGIPAGVFSVVPASNSQAFGQEICSNEKVRKLTFTGSTHVGRLLMRQASDRVMKLSLELGGNAPFIVFDDADIDAAVEGAIVSKFRNAGQTCVCANRFYIQSGVYAAFAEKLAKKVSELVVGDGFTENSMIGPLIDDRAVAKVRRQIEDAISKGASLVVGGEVAPIGPLFFTPSVLTDVTSEMDFAREETFGPVAPLFKFDTTLDVIQMANDTQFGLAAYFYSNDHRKIWAVVEALEYGIVGINTGHISTEVAPFGGIKQSGFGREGSMYGIDDYLEIKYACFGGMTSGVTGFF